MCGIAGISLADPAASAAADILEALWLLQHRGQSACGIATCSANSKDFQRVVGTGLVSEVFTDPEACLPQLTGHIGIGHVRYPTAGFRREGNVQPLASKAARNVILAHNGNLTSTSRAMEKFGSVGGSDVGTCDSEIVLDILVSGFEDHCAQACTTSSICQGTLQHGLANVYRHCQGSYACVVAIPGYGLLAFRDAHGIKPLLYGHRVDDNGGDCYMCASESVVLDKLGFTGITDILPGQAVLFPYADSMPRILQVAPPKAYALDAFEVVYFSRPESVMDGISVYRARQYMGQELVDAALSMLEGSTSGVVVPVPETSYVSANALAQALGLPMEFGLAKSRYITRTFIMPGQKHRRKGVWRKLSVVAEVVRDRDVLLVDDSIVRGTTSKEIVRMLRDAGARRVFFASASPPIQNCHIHGIDLARRSSLVANGRTAKVVAQEIGADAVAYLKPEALLRALRKARLSEQAPSEFEMGVFTGAYTTPGAWEYITKAEDAEDAEEEESVNPKMVDSGIGGMDWAPLGTS